MEGENKKLSQESQTETGVHSLKIPPAFTVGIITIIVAIAGVEILRSTSFGSSIFFPVVMTLAGAIQIVGVAVATVSLWKVLSFFPGKYTAWG